MGRREPRNPQPRRQLKSLQPRRELRSLQPKRELKSPQPRRELRSPQPRRELRNPQTRRKERRKDFKKYLPIKTEIIQKMGYPDKPGRLGGDTTTPTLRKWTGYLGHF